MKLKLQMLPSFLVASLLAFLLTGTMSFAEQQVLVDFSQLAIADNDSEHEPTIVDFSQTAPIGLSQEEVQALRTSYAIKNWRVELSSSIQFPQSLNASVVRQVPVSQSSELFAGEDLLGFRVLFPDYNFDMYAYLVPPIAPLAGLDTQAVDANGDIVTAPEDLNKGNKFLGYGLIKNVAVINSATMTVYGLNQPEKIYVDLLDHEGKQYELAFGDLKFFGWDTLTYNNEAYISDIYDRPIIDLPVYPQLSSDIFFDKIKIFRSRYFGTTDFVTYVRDIVIDYDPVTDLDIFEDIDHEGTWQIISQSQQRRNRILFERVSREEFLRYLQKRGNIDVDDAGDAEAGL